MTWIKDALYPKLVPLLRLAYHCPGCDQSHQNKVLKVISLADFQYIYVGSYIKSKRGSVIAGHWYLEGKGILWTSNHQCHSERGRPVY